MLNSAICNQQQPAISNHQSAISRVPRGFGGRSAARVSQADAIRIPAAAAWAAPVLTGGGRSERAERKPSGGKRASRFLAASLITVIRDDADDPGRCRPRSLSSNRVPTRRGCGRVRATSAFPASGAGRRRAIPATPSISAAEVPRAAVPGSNVEIRPGHRDPCEAVCLIASNRIWIAGPIASTGMNSASPCIDMIDAAGTIPGKKP